MVPGPFPRAGRDVLMPGRPRRALRPVRGRHLWHESLLSVLTSVFLTEPPIPSLRVRQDRLQFLRHAGEIRRTGPKDRSADVAQLVEHHLAKVRVAGSNPVVRSEARLYGALAAGEAAPAAEWPSGLGKGLQSPVHGFDSRLRLRSSP
jgi:hypothetical protein